MNKLVGIFSLTTVVFASSTVYLALELHARNATMSAGVTATTTLAPAARAVASSERTRPAAVDTSVQGQSPLSPALTSTTAPAGTPDASAKADAQADAGRLFARQFLARYDDPLQHANMLDEAKTGLRRQYARLKDQLKLSDATFEELVTLLADEGLLMQEHYFRCSMDTRCDQNDPARRPPYDAHSQEVLALLGSDRIQAFTDFRGRIAERDAVVQLRGRLPDTNFLPEAKAELLITALADERERYQREASEQGAKLSGWGTQLGMLMYIQDSGSVEQYIVEATKYSQRLRSRAAAVLSPAQLAAYAQMQDELLAQMGSYLRPAPTPRKANSTTLRSS